MPRGRYRGGGSLCETAAAEEFPSEAAAVGRGEVPSEAAAAEGRRCLRPG